MLISTTSTIAGASVQSHLGMDHVLFTKVSKAFHEQERKVAIQAALCSKINPIILIAYLLLLTVDSIMYFRFFLANGHPRSGWLSLGIIIAIPIVLSLLCNFLRSRLRPKAEAACTVPVPEWDPDRFSDMDSILAEKKRLHSKYKASFWPPVFGFLLSPAVIVLCYRCAAAMAGSPAPAWIVLRLVLMGLFYSIYGLLATLCCGESTVPHLSHEVDAAVREYAKAKGRILKEERRILAENQAAFQQAHRLDKMVEKALRQTPPNIHLLYTAASQGAENAIVPIGRALVPLLIDHYPKPYELETVHKKRRLDYDAMVAAFEQYAVPLAEAGNPELEFALMAARYYSHRPMQWFDLRDRAIPRVQALMSGSAISTQWGDIPKRFLADMEYIVAIYERAPSQFGSVSDGTSLPDSIQDELDAIQKNLAQAGLCEPLPDLTTDV